MATIHSLSHGDCLEEGKFGKKWWQPSCPVMGMREFQNGIRAEEKKANLNGNNLVRSIAKIKIKREIVGGWSSGTSGGASALHSLT